MRSLRWLLLVAMVLIAAAVFSIYRVQRRAQQAHRRPVPPAIPLDTRTMAPDWEWEQSANGLPAVKISARNMKQSADGSVAELQGIELDIYAKDGQHYDRVKSAYAHFTTNDHKLFSPGDAQITLQVPVHGDPPHPLTSITTSGINFDSESGQAVTDKHVAFTFEQGEGTATGATYDPNTHILLLNKDVVVNLRGKTAGSMPMKVEAGQLSWNETNGNLLLLDWSRLTRDQTVVDAAGSTVLLKDNSIVSIDTTKAHGTDKRPGRNIEYSADAVHVQYNDNHEIQQITGLGNAKLIAHGDASDTTIGGVRVDLNFVQHDNQDVLSTATASGAGYLESKPHPDPGGDTADTKILKSEIIDLTMRTGGKELERVNTQTAGTLEFLPNQSARHRRLLKADRMVINYAERNQIQSFHATTLTKNLASTETDPSQDDRRKTKANLVTSFTSSRTIDASFADKDQLKVMKQTGDFHYIAGARKAQADDAALDNHSNIMDLDKHARISDGSGSTVGDHIRLDQMTGDFDATGHVSTTRVAEGQKSASAMLDKDEPMLGSADHVTSADHNHLIRYRGNAVVWQTSNRIEAERIDIDRDKKSIVADGHVITQFEDKPKDDTDNTGAAGSGPAPPAAAAKPLQPTYTIVKAPHMVYTDADRLAIYTGGVDFWRPQMTVKSAALKAYLNPDNSDADSRINRAIGDGKVEIVEYAPDRQRLGSSEHAEYYTDEGKVILSGGAPKLNDTKRGNTTGEKLTWFTDDDRLIIDGAPKKAGRSHLHKKS